MTQKAKKHPVSLPYLFFTEMWERFGFYLLLAIFVLYLKDTEQGGRGLSTGIASDIYGTFLGLIYLTPFIGGLLADRILGYRLSISIGGIMMGIGYCLLAVPGDIAFYSALGLIVLGNGFFKPNISTLLGNVYNAPEYLEKKDAGYNIFYMGINLGALISPFIAAYLRNTYGWGYAFIGAGVGMFIGVITFWIGSKHYKHADVLKEKKKGEGSIFAILIATLIPALGLGGLFYYLESAQIIGSFTGSITTDAFLIGTVPVIAYYLFLMIKSEAEDRRSIAALLTIMGIVVIFWAIFKQNGTALTVWAESYTDREISEPFVPAAKSVGMVKEITFSKDSLVQLDHHFRLVKDEAGNTLKTFEYPSYFKNLSPEKTPKEGETIATVSTEIFQSVNPFFVILLTPLVVGFFIFMRKRKREPNTAAKIGLGMLITAISALVMVFAVYSSSNGLTKADMSWLISCYAVITIGELFLSPMGLSLVSKLSPPRYTSLLMGGWFLSTSIGIKLSGLLASFWDKYEDKSNFFIVNMIIVASAGVLVFLLLPWLTRSINTKLKKAN